METDEAGETHMARKKREAKARAMEQNECAGGSIRGDDAHRHRTEHLEQTVENVKNRVVDNENKNKVFREIILSKQSSVVE